MTRRFSAHAMNIFMKKKIQFRMALFYPFLTRELRACARASYRYDVGNGIRSLARSIGRFL